MSCNKVCLAQLWISFLYSAVVCLLLNKFTFIRVRSLLLDLRLISDLVIIIMSASVGAAIFTMMRQPLIIGYIVAGSGVGPGGLGLVLELVQVSSYLFLIGIQHDQALS